MVCVFCRRQQHFESNHATCANTVVNMLPSVFQAVMDHFDTCSITAQLKTDPENKLHLWGQLKTASKHRHWNIAVEARYYCAGPMRETEKDVVFS